MPPELCVIFNPAAARGRAGQGLDQWRRRLADRAEFRPSASPGHAEELAYEAASVGVPVIGAAGGDGTVHEVANGLLRAGHPETRLAVFPLGSANDYAYSLERALAGAGGARLVDVGLVRGDQGRQRYFLNTLGLGFSGAVTIESRAIKRLRGLPLYGLGFLRALWRRFDLPDMTVTLDDWTHQGPTLSLTVALAHREGSMIVAPAAELDDGLFDYLLAGALSRWQVLRFLPTLVRGGALPKGYPGLWRGRCREARVESACPLTVHLDGEFFCQPADNVRHLEIRLLPRHLLVQIGVAEGGQAR